MGNYAEIPSNDDAESTDDAFDHHHHAKPSRTTFKTLSVSLATVFLLGSQFYLLLQGIHQTSTNPDTPAAAPEPEPERHDHAPDYFGDCGPSHTVDEAVAHGCVFDPASWIWTRPECYDGNLVDAFMKRAEFSYHTDPGLGRDSRVSLGEVRLGNHSLLYTQPVYHYLHCTHMMKRLHRAFLNHGPIDSYLRSWDHTLHCEMIVLSDFLHEDVGLECPPGEVCPTWLGKPQWTSCSR